MLPTSEVLVVAAVVVGVLLVVGGTILARKPAEAPAQTAASAEAAAAEKPAQPWWAEVVGPNANPTPEEQNEILERLKLLGTPWANSVASKAPPSSP